MSVALGVVLLLGWVNRHDRRRLGGLGAAALLAVTLARPPQAQGQGMLHEIMVVLSTIDSNLGKWLTKINTVETDIRQVQQSLVWPQSMIQQAHNWSASWLRNYETSMRQLFVYRPSSAQLQHALDLEKVLTDANGSNLPTLIGRYQQLYGAVPAVNEMKPADRDMTDMDDALALDTLAQLKRGDQVNQAVRASGDALEEMTTSAAPGTAPFITATALVTMLKSQAVTQKMLAAFLRQNSAQLAHRTAGQKAAIGATADWHQTILKTLAR